MPAVAAREDWELPAEPASVTLARGRVRAFAQEHGATPDDVVDLSLAVTEAVTNSVIHAFIDRDPGRVRVTISTAADELTVVVADCSDVFDSKTQAGTCHHRAGDLTACTQNFLAKRLLAGISGKVRKENQRVGGIQAHADDVEIGHAF